MKVPINSIGLVFDGLGALILLGPEYDTLKSLIKKFDPIHQYFSFGIKKMETQKERIDTGVPANYWGTIGIRRVIEDMSGRAIGNDCELGSNSLFVLTVNEEEITRPSEDVSGERLLNINHVKNRCDVLLERRLYRTGISFLLFGFSPQLFSNIV